MLCSMSLDPRLCGWRESLAMGTRLGLKGCTCKYHTRVYLSLDSVDHCSYNGSVDEAINHVRETLQEQTQVETQDNRRRNHRKACLVVGYTTVIIGTLEIKEPQQQILILTFWLKKYGLQEEMGGGEWGIVQHHNTFAQHHRLATVWEWCYTISGWMVTPCKLCHYGNNVCRLVLAMFLGLCYFYSFGCIYDSTWK